MTNTEDLNAPAPTIPMPTVFYVQESTGDVYEHGTDGRVFLMKGGYLQKDGWAADLGALKRYVPDNPPKGVTRDLVFSLIVLAFFIPWCAVGLTMSHDQDSPPLWWQAVTTVLVSILWGMVGVSMYLRLKGRR